MRLKLALLSIVLFLWTTVRVWPSSVTPGCFFTALDIGQGDAILIQTPDGQDVLVDGGPSAAVVDQLGKYLPPGDRDIELVILTHPDSDHVTGLVSVLRRYEVKQILTSDIPTQTAIFEAWQTTVQEKHIPFEYVHLGQEFILGSDLTLNVLWPPPGDGWKVSGGGTPTNDGSVSIHLTCGRSTAVLTGDASAAVEDRILASGLSLRASLFKVGHHGSRTSNRHEFIRAIDPDVAVISVGAKNRYHHPHPATLERFQKAGIEVLRTDELGAIRLKSNGSGSWKMVP